MSLLGFLRKPAATLADLRPHAEVHCHILPGVDDGFQQPEDSYEALRRLQALGVERVQLTPHMNLDDFAGNTEEMLRERFEAFRMALPADLTLRLSLGAEYMVNEQLDLQRPFLCFAGRRVLIEMSYYYESRNIKDAIFELCLQDYHPVLAHPERYLYYSRDMKPLEEYVRMGCSLQLNLLSLTPYYSPETIRMGYSLLDKGLYRYAGTDLHSLRQLDRLQAMKIDRKYLDKIQQLLDNNRELFD